MATKEQLEEIIEQVKISHKWMLESIRHDHSTDGLNEGNFSDELKHAIVVEEMLEMV